MLHSVALAWTWLLAKLRALPNWSLYALTFAALLGVGTFFWWMTQPPFHTMPAQPPPPEPKADPLPLPRRQVSKSPGAEAMKPMGPEPAPVETRPLSIKRKLVPFDAAKIALLDALQYDPVKDAPFLRYIFIPDDPNIWVPTINFTVNMCISQSSFIQYGTQIHPNVIRYDLRLLAPQQVDLDNLLNTFEQFAFDPYFHEFVLLEDGVDVAREQATDGLKIFLEKAGVALVNFQNVLNAVGGQQVANVDQQNRDLALKALAKMREELAKLNNEQEQIDFLRLVELDSRLRKAGGLDDKFVKEFVDQANLSLDGATIDSFKSALQALRDAVVLAGKSNGQAADDAAIAAAQKVVATLKIAQLKAELSRTRVFDLVFLNQFVKDVDAAIKALSTDVRLKHLVETLKLLRDTVATLAAEAEKVEDVEIVGRRSAAGGLGNNVEIPVPARHAGVALELLFELVQSDAAIVYGPHFLHRTTSTVDLGHGAGLYYQFVGIQTNINDGLNDFQRFLKDLGIDLEQIDILRSKNSAAIYTSNVTGRERKVVLVQGSGARPGVAGGLVSYTQDPSEDQTDAANSPIRNLIDFEFAAQEAIGDRNNGMLIWALFNAAGVLQNSAPDNVVADHSVPSPYCRRLHCCISCIRCHGPQRGHMPIKNDVDLLTSKGIDLLDDLSSADNLDDLLDRLVGEYRFDPSDPTSRAPLVRSRDDFGNAVYYATAGIGRPGLPLNQVYQYPRGMTTPEACGHMGTLWNDYAYTWVTPLIALKEMGYEVESEKEAAKLIRHVIPAIGPDPVFGLTLLDPTIAAVRIGIPIPRASWELVVFDAYLRALLTSPEVASLELSPQKHRSKSGRKPLTRPVTTKKTLDSIRLGAPKGKAKTKETSTPKS